MDSSGNIQLRVSARSRPFGFTLIELMIVVAVVAILAAVALPSYALFMKKSRRADAEATLMDIAQREQQYLLDTRAYAGTAALGTSLPALPADVSAYYTVTITLGGPPPTFLISAIPIAGSPQAGDYTLTLDDKGAKAPASIW